MNAWLRSIISLLVGCVLGCSLLAGFCSIPGLRSSNACGHNVYIWVPLVVPAGIVICWMLLGMIGRIRRRRTGARSNTQTPS